jgi:hypothetical protein
MAALRSVICLSAQRSIIRRRKAIGDDYPFQIDDNGHALHLVSPVTTVGSIYLFCLFLSHSFNRVILPKEQAPEVRHPPQSGWLDELGRLKGG